MIFQKLDIGNVDRNSVELCRMLDFGYSDIKHFASLTKLLSVHTRHIQTEPTGAILTKIKQCAVARTATKRPRNVFPVTATKRNTSMYINRRDAHNSVIRLYFPLDALHV